jgi:hypothetical protein
MWSYNEDEDETCCECGYDPCECAEIDACYVKDEATKIFRKEGYDAALQYCRDNATLRYHRCATYEELMLRVIQDSWFSFISEMVDGLMAQRRKLHASHSALRGATDILWNGLLVPTCVYRDKSSGKIPTPGEVNASRRVMLLYTEGMSKYVPFMEHLSFLGFEETLGRKPNAGDLVPFYNFLWKQTSGRRRSRFFEDLYMASV